MKVDTILAETFINKTVAVIVLAITQF